MEPSAVRAGIPARVLLRSTGAALCAPRARALCSCFTVDGPDIHIRGTSNRGRAWFLAPGSEGRAREWHRAPRAAAQRGERSSSAACRAALAFRPPCTEHWLGCRPMWLPGCPEGQAVGCLPVKAGRPLSGKTLVNEPRHPAVYFLAASSRMFII